MASNWFRNSEWIGSRQQDQLMEEFFHDSPIIVDWDFHGYQKVTKDNRIVLGSWNGPRNCLKGLIHEMAHLVEIDDDRMLLPAWGLTNPQVYIQAGKYSRMVAMPKTIQSLLRECRVNAMQLQLQHYLGMNDNCIDTKSVIAFSHMPDFYNIPLKKNQSGDKERYSFIVKKVIQYSRGKYTLDFFRQEWKRKNELLKKAQTNVQPIK